MKTSKTHVVNVRVDLRHFATAYMYFSNKRLDEIRQSKGRTISLAFRFFVQMIIDKHPEYEFPTHSLAIEYLEQEQVIRLEDSFRNKFSLVQELQRESLEEEGIDSSIIMKPKIRKHQQKVLPPGIESQQQIDKMNADLQKRLSEPHDLEPETLEQAAARRRKADNKMKESFQNLAKSE